MSDEEPGTRPFAVTVYATDGTPCVLSGRMRTWEGLPEYERKEIIRMLADVLVKDMREHMAGRPYVRADGELIYLVPWQGERVAVSRCPDPVSRKRLVELLSDEVFKLPVATPLREVHAALVALQQEMLAHPPRGRRRKSSARTAEAMRRRNSECATIRAMASRVCTVALTDSAGVRHSVEVSAETLFEAAALGLAAMKREEWVNGDGPGATLEILVTPPVVRHSVSVQHVQEWLDGVTTSPKERVKKERLKALLGR